MYSKSFVPSDLSHTKLLSVCIVASFPGHSPDFISQLWKNFLHSWEINLGEFFFTAGSGLGMRLPGSGPGTRLYVLYKHWYLPVPRAHKNGRLE